MFLALGMTYELYWDGDNDLPRAYLEAEKIRDRKKNQWLWLQGMYVYDAVGRLIPAFKFGVKNPKAEQYPREPYPITKEEIEEREKKKFYSMLERMKSRVEEQNGRN